VKEFGWNAAISSCNDGDGPRRRDAGAACYTGGGVGNPSCEASQQLVIDGRHAARDLLKGGTIKFEHDRVAHRNDGRGAQSSGKKGDFADRQARADFGQRNRLSFNSDLKSAGNDDENCIGSRILQDECFAAQQLANCGPRPDLCLLIG
jgi:hypothetical protein